MNKIKTVRKSGLTFAPEAGSQRMRDVINKNVREDELLQTCTTAFAGGWTTVKLYFMIGLPTETMDAKGQVGACNRVCILFCTKTVHPVSMGTAGYNPCSS